jgi:hypothetical protein
VTLRGAESGRGGELTAVEGGRPPPRALSTTRPGLDGPPPPAFSPFPPPQARDVHLESFTLLFHGHELLTDAKLELNHGR